jgi:hypothetical protein
MTSETHLLALTRHKPGSSLEQEMPVIASALGLGLYDARMRLVSPLPSILASGLSLQDAQRLLALLRGRGHGAVACDAATIPGHERALVARGFELAPSAFVVLDAQKRRLEVPHAQILGVVRAAEQSSETRSIETREKKLSVGRALLSGGVMLNKTVTKVEQSASADLQQVAYLFRSTTPEALLLEERSLSFEGLGSARGSSARQSFEALMLALKRAAPAALHDDSLRKHKRRVELTAVRGLASERTVTDSNAPANALAAHLLMLGHLQQQL